MAGPDLISALMISDSVFLLLYPAISQVPKGDGTFSLLRKRDETALDNFGAKERKL